MAKSKRMELVKGVSADQHIEIHSILYSGAANDRSITVQFGRWGSRASYDAGEKPLTLYPPLVLRGKSMAVFKRQRNLAGAAWALLDMVLAGTLPAEMRDSLEFPDRGMSDDLNGSSLVLEPDEEPFTLDLGA